MEENPLSRRRRWLPLLLPILGLAVLVTVILIAVPTAPPPHQPQETDTIPGAGSQENAAPPQPARGWHPDPEFQKGPAPVSGWKPDSPLTRPASGWRPDNVPPSAPPPPLVEDTVPPAQGAADAVRLNDDMKEKKRQAEFRRDREG